MPFAPPDSTIAVAYLDDDRLKLGEGTVRQYIGTDEGQPHGSQYNLLQSHRSYSGMCVVTQSPRSMDPLMPLDLAAVHDAAGLRIERIAPVQHGKIVPHQEVSDFPLVTQRKLRLRCMRPQGIKQRVALGHLETEHMGVRTTTEKERPASGGRLGANERM